jgi:hypothetical protein
MRWYRLNRFSAMRGVAANGSRRIEMLEATNNEGVDTPEESENLESIFIETLEALSETTEELEDTHWLIQHLT